MIISLTGKKQSGKSTIANYLVEKHNFIELSFAQYLKEACKILFNWDENDYSTDNKEKVDKLWGKSPREILQYMGTEILRDNMKNIIDTSIKELNKTYSFHIKRLYQDIKKYPDKNIVISDVRFPDELDFCIKINSKIIKVERDTISNQYSNHKSETSLENIKFDNIIKNNKSRKELYEKIDIYI
jgi:ABC-type transporter MlaC component